MRLFALEEVIPRGLADDLVGGDLHPSLVQDHSEARQRSVNPIFGKVQARDQPAVEEFLELRTSSPRLPIRSTGRARGGGLRINRGGGDRDKPAGGL